MMAWQGSIAGQPIVAAMDKQPFPRSYWVVPGHLLAGYFPGDMDKVAMEQKLGSLLDCGIRHIVNLMEADERDHHGQIFVDYVEMFSVIARQRGLQATTVRFPVRDVSIPSRDTMRDILDNIDFAIQRKVSVYVHCWGGKGRTGTVVGCFLARHGIAVGNEALSMIQHLRLCDPTSGEPSPETGEQRAMVVSWAESNTVQKEPS